MKLANLFLSSLFSAGIIAAPDSKKVEIDPHHGYVHHHGLKCTIENTSEVNCRSGPGIEYEVVTSLKKDFEGTFTCVERGECVTIDGFQNWYVSSRVRLRLWLTNSTILAGGIVFTTSAFPATLAATTPQKSARSRILDGAMARSQADKATVKTFWLHLGTAHSEFSVGSLVKLGLGSLERYLLRTKPQCYTCR